MLEQSLDHSPLHVHRRLHFSRMSLGQILLLQARCCCWVSAWAPESWNALVRALHTLETLLWLWRTSGSIEIGRGSVPSTAGASKTLGSSIESSRDAVVVFAAASVVADGWGALKLLLGRWNIDDRLIDLIVVLIHHNLNDARSLRDTGDDRVSVRIVRAI